jgi:hypothetical protein
LADDLAARLTLLLHHVFHICDSLDCTVSAGDDRDALCRSSVSSVIVLTIRAKLMRSCSDMTSSARSSSSHVTSASVSRKSLLACKRSERIWSQAATQWQAADASARRVAAPSLRGQATMPRGRRCTRWNGRLNGFSSKRVVIELRSGMAVTGPNPIDPPTRRQPWGGPTATYPLRGLDPRLGPSRGSCFRGCLHPRLRRWSAAVWRNRHLVCSPSA